MASERGQRREQILQVLASMLASNPGGRITTAALAATVGVSEAALYRHFPSKARMFEGLIAFIEETLFTRISRIVAETDEDQTWFSPVGTGGIMMNIAGRIRNNSDKTLTGLEIKASVIDSFGKVVKDNTVLVVPNQKAKLAPKEQMNVTIRIDGFKRDDDRAQIRWKVTAIKTE